MILTFWKFQKILFVFVVHRPTSSIEFSTMYRVVVTDFVCPMRWTRSRACSSTVGFQCGSIIYTREAVVRSKLLVSIFSNQTNRLIIVESYPTAPQPRESNMTLTSCFDWKACNAADLSPMDKRPWYLTYSMESPSAVAIRSSVVVQKEKTTLLTLVSSGNTCDMPTSFQQDRVLSTRPQYSQPLRICMTGVRVGWTMGW